MDQRASCEQVRESAAGSEPLKPDAEIVNARLSLIDIPLGHEIRRYDPL